METGQKSTGISQTAPRAIPRSRFWFLFLLYLLFSLAGWARMISVFTDWSWLTFAGVRPGPQYIAITGGLWGIVGLVGLILVVLRRPGWYRWGVGLAFFFALTYWIDRLFFRAPGIGADNQAFAIVLTVIALLIAMNLQIPLQQRRMMIEKINPLDLFRKKI